MSGVERSVEVLAEHRYRDVLGDYEIKPYYKHFGCSCGWEQNIAGMSGWRSWVAAHETHVAAALSAAGCLRDDRERVDLLDGSLDATVGAEGEAPEPPLDRKVRDLAALAYLVVTCEADDLTETPLFRWLASENPGAIDSLAAAEASRADWSQVEGCSS